MMKPIFTLLLTSFAFLQAEMPEEITYSAEKIASSNSKKPVAYDADLYHKNVECVSAHVEFLYWVAQEGALDYALKMTSAPYSTSSGDYAQGDFQVGQYYLDPGVRIAGSYYNASKFWELKAQYTRLTNRGHNSAGTPEASGEYLNGTWPQVFSATMASARSSLHLNYNVATVGVARMYNPNPHLRMRLVTDLVTAWINQSWNIHYVSSSNDLTKVSNRWGFIGAGLAMGMTADWFWGNDIYLSGGASVSLLLGQYTNHAYQNSSFGSTPANPTFPLRNTNYRDTRAIYAPQVLIGPSWQRNYNHSRWEVFCGYELISWFNLQEVFHSTSGSPQAAKETWINTGSLALQGLTTRLSVDF